MQSLGFFHQRLSCTGAPRMPWGMGRSSLFPTKPGSGDWGGGKEQLDDFLQSKACWGKFLGLKPEQGPLGLRECLREEAGQWAFRSEAGLGLGSLEK